MKIEKAVVIAQIGINELSDYFGRIFRRVSKELFKVSFYSSSHEYNSSVHKLVLINQMLTSLVLILKNDLLQKSLLPANEIAHLV